MLADQATQAADYSDSRFAGRFRKSESRSLYRPEKLGSAKTYYSRDIHRLTSYRAVCCNRRVPSYATHINTLRKVSAVQTRDRDPCYRGRTNHRAYLQPTQRDPCYRGRTCWSGEVLFRCQRGVATARTGGLDRMPSGGHSEVVHEACQPDPLPEGSRRG